MSKKKRKKAESDKEKTLLSRHIEKLTQELIKRDRSMRARRAAARRKRGA